MAIPAFDLLWALLCWGGGDWFILYESKDKACVLHPFHSYTPRWPNFEWVSEPDLCVVPDAFFTFNSLFIAPPWRIATATI